MNKKTAASLLIGSAFSFIGLYLAFRNVPLSSLLRYAAEVNYWWTVPAALSLVGAYFIRSLRWQWLLLSAGRISLSSAYHSLIISMMINCLLPGRIGELARPMVLKKKEQMPMATSLAALGVERLLDLLALLILLLPTLMALTPDADPVIDFGDYRLSRGLLVDLGYTFFIALVGLILAVFSLGHDRLRHRCLAWISLLPAFLERLRPGKPEGLVHRAVPQLVAFIERSAQGVKYVCNFRGFIVATAISLAFWGFNALMFYFLSIGSPGIELAFIDICGVMVIICFFIALPSVPGFWGLWEAAGVFA
ncbi:MAG: lysylphosphatidylglycerol synthase transmembrane domain-containing protein, partial [Desulfobacterales bacterium]